MMDTKDNWGRGRKCAIKIICLPDHSVIKYALKKKTQQSGESSCCTVLLLNVAHVCLPPLKKKIGTNSILQRGDSCTHAVSLCHCLLLPFCKWTSIEHFIQWHPLFWLHCCCFRGSVMSGQKSPSQMQKQTTGQSTLDSVIFFLERSRSTHFPKFSHFVLRKKGTKPNPLPVLSCHEQWQVCRVDAIFPK